MSPSSSSIAVKHGPCLLTLKTKRIQAFETKCMQKLICIYYLVHKTNNWVRNKINFKMGPQETLLANVKSRKLAWFGPVTGHDSLAKTPFRARCCGWKRKCWMDNIKKWTPLLVPELLIRAPCREDWKKIC